VSAGQHPGAARTIDDDVAKAMARLDAKPDHILTCGACGHSHPVPHDPVQSRYQCDQCGARTTFGVEMPRITITPHVDRRFVVIHFAQGRDEKKVDVAITLERDYAAEFVMETLSVCQPAKFRAFQAMFAAAHDVPGLSTGANEDAALVLDGGPPDPVEAAREG
jgi:hypothetical protein